MTNGGFQGMYFTRPSNARQFHIFKDSRSLCGRWMMLAVDKNNCSDVTGQEILSKEDCKTCFKKAGFTVHSTRTQK